MTTTSDSGVANATRRRLLGVIPAALTLPWWASSVCSAAADSAPAATAGQETWVSAEGAEAGHFGLGWINPQHQQAGSVLAGFRGHGLAQHPLQPNLVVLLGRAPGRELAVIDLAAAEAEQRIQCAAGYHLAGHGCFSPDGQWLFTTESDFIRGQGRIVVRDTRRWQIHADYPSHGIGPHEIRFMPDGKTLVVANGGLLTHPDSGDKVLNLDRMDSSLVYLDAASGVLLSAWRLPEPKASIRHLDIAPDATVAVATQVQRQAMKADRLVALGAIHKPGQELQLLAEPAVILQQFDDYMGSVAINARERIAGFSSPRGNLVAFWHLDSRQLVGYQPFYDVCGLACSHDQQHFVLSNSSGEVRRVDARSLKEDKSLRMQFDGRHWDNHMTSLWLPEVLATPSLFSSAPVA
jgi:uncharacterized protein